MTKPGRTVELQALLFSLFAVANANTRNISLTEIFEGLQSPGFPFLATFFIYLRLKRKTEELLRFQLTLEDANGAIVWSIPEGVLPLQPERPVVSLLIQASVSFAAPQTYTVKAFVDGTEIGREELKVQVAKLPVKS